MGTASSKCTASIKHTVPSKCTTPRKRSAPVTWIQFYSLLLVGDEAGHANTAHTVRKLLGAGLIAPELTLLTEGWQLDGRLREISQLKL